MIVRSTTYLLSYSFGYLYLMKNNVVLKMHLGSSYVKNGVKPEVVISLSFPEIWVTWNQMVFSIYWAESLIK